MKKHFLILLLLNFSTVFISSSQVGLLSSNNKETNYNSGSDTNNLPRLVLTKELGSYSSIGDTQTIRLNFKTDVSDSVNSLKNLINKKVLDISNFNNALGNIAERINSLKAKKFRESRKEQERSQKQIRLLETEIKSVKVQKEKAENANDSLIRELGRQVSRTQLSDSLNRKLIEEIVNKRAEAFNERLSVLNKYNSNNTADLYQNQYNINSYWFLIDSTKDKFNKNSFLDSLSKIYSEIRIQSDANASLTKYIENARDKFNNLKEISENTIIASPQDYEKLNKAWKNLEKDTSDIGEKIRSAFKNIENTVANYNGILRNNIRDKVEKKEDKTTEFGGLPQVTNILGKKEVITQLQLYGSYTYQSKSTSTEGNLGLSFSSNSAPDTNNLYALFIPTASKYLINSSFTFGFWTTNRSLSNDNDSAKRLGIKMDFALAGKNMVFDTTKTTRSINNTVFYTKTRLEFGVLPKRFSIYANVNTVTILDKAAEFKFATNLDSKFFGFVDCGTKFYLDPTGHSDKKDDGLYIYANINAIINGGDVKRITKTDDLVIPSIQIGLVKRLGKF